MVQAQLHDVQQIQSAEHAFAAIRSDGRVVTWGNGTLTVEKWWKNQVESEFLL